MKNRRSPIRPLFLIAIALSGAACGNMKEQRNLRPGEPSAFFHDGLSSRDAPAHTIARGQPSPGDPRETGFRHGAPLAHNPDALTAALLARGQERFNIHCAACHGEDGYGTGIVVRRGFPPPPSFHDKRLREAADGNLFDAITRGYGTMLPFADRMPADDRWAVVAYLRALQRSQRAALADVPLENRRALDSP